MKTAQRLLSYLTLAVLVTGLAHARIEREFSETFSVNAGGDLVVSTQGGDIEVERGANDAVTVVARVVFPRATSESEADELMEEIELVIEETADGVSASSKRPKKTSSWFNWGGSNQVAVHFSVTVPEEYHVNTRTSGGDIEISDLTGEVVARTSGGDIEVGHINGPVDLNTSGGDIKIRHAVGEVKAHTSGDNVRVEDAEGSVNAGTSGGNIYIGRVIGQLNASTSGGNVSARLQGPLLVDAVLSTSVGEVTAWVDEDIGFHLDARTSGGGVKADGITIKIDSGGAGKSKLVGDVNGGGPTLKLRSSGGNVKIRTT
ncbi:DUF4097 domain-containing protein [Opitutaceae bacterium]|nr:DUF4097 domain-containing protein [Opitutaceae bacterium]